MKLLEHLKNTFVNKQKISSIGINWILVGVGVVATRYIWQIIKRRVKKTPPGPILFTVPYFGSFFSFLFYKLDFHRKILPQYGPLCFYTIGNSEFISLNDAKLGQKVLNNPLCVDRPLIFRQMFLDANVSMPLFGVCQNKQELWSIRRKILTNAMINVSKHSYPSRCDYVTHSVKYMFEKYLYNAIDRKIQSKINYSDKFDYNAYDTGTVWRNLADDIRHTSINIVFGALFGTNIEYEFGINNVDFNTMDQSIKDFGKQAPVIIGLSCFPSLKRLFFQSKTNKIARAIKNAGTIVDKYFLKAFKEYNEKKNNNSIDNNFTLFDEMCNEYKRENIELSNEINSDNLILGDMYSILLPNLNPVVLVVETCLMYLAKYPQLQNDIYNELRQVLESENTKNVSNDDNKKVFFNFERYKHSCPKFRAFIHETLRIITPTPRGIPRILTKDCILQFDSLVFI